MAGKPRVRRPRRPSKAKQTFTLKEVKERYFPNRDLVNSEPYVVVAPQNTFIDLLKTVNHQAQFQAQHSVSNHHS